MPKGNLEAQLGEQNPLGTNECQGETWKHDLGNRTLSGIRNGQRGKVIGKGQRETWKQEPKTRIWRLGLKIGKTSEKRERPRGNPEARTEERNPPGKRHWKT
jgi:hypothetical protein